MLSILSARRSFFVVCLAVVALFCSPAAAAEGGHHGVDGAKLGLWLVIPFAGLLLSIAVCPLVAPKFWHHHYGKVAAAFGVIAVLLMIVIGEDNGGGFMPTLQSAAHVYLLDYVPFIVLLLGLFTIAGGIYIRGDFRGTPLTNTMFLLVGTVIASWVGTTGASMLMIQPVLRANKQRKKKVHIIVFFIFLVSNIGGSLTPLGDPPLFLGFLKGVSFFWTFHLLPETLFCATLLLILFFVFDTIIYRSDALPIPDASQPRERFGLAGAHNLIFLGGLVAAVVGYGSLQKAGLFYDAAATEHEKAEAALLEGYAEEAESKKLDDPVAEAARIKALLTKVEEQECVWGYASTLERAEASEIEELALHEASKDTPKEAELRKKIMTAVQRFRADIDAEYRDVDAKLSQATSESATAAKSLDDARVALAKTLRSHASAVLAVPRDKAVKSVHLGSVSHLPFSNIARELLILAMAALSLFTTRKVIRDSNNFNWGPIKEVAKLFAGIFVCMVPALAILAAGKEGALAFIVNNVERPWQYFWATGMLSSFLDNAPTYLVFFQTAQATPMSAFAARGLDPDPVSALVNMPHIILVAISCGAVFMGANTYIGNAPNFMVKAIAEENDVKMPSFIGYMLWSVGILVPLFVLLTLLFLR
jgi:Na+/H+ antiporter NhaD/arsenite permease-like protein